MCIRDRDISAKRVQTTKDCIAPTQIDWRPDGMFNDCFKLDNGAVSYTHLDVYKRQINNPFQSFTDDRLVIYQ